MRKTHEEEAGVPMSSLIDIVFLLIIFFVLTASIQNEVTDYKIKLAESKFEPVTALFREWRAGSEYSLEQIKNMLMRAKDAHGDAMTVILRASEDLEYGEVDKVNYVVTDVGIATIAHASTSKYERPGSE